MQNEKVVDLLCEFRECVYSLRLVDAFLVLTKIHKSDAYGSELFQLDKFSRLEDTLVHMQKSLTASANRGQSDGDLVNVDFLVDDLRALLGQMVDVELEYRSLAPMGAYAVMKSEGEKISSIEDVLQRIDQFETRDMRLHFDEVMPEDQLWEATDNLNKEWNDLRIALFGYVVTSRAWDNDTMNVFLSKFMHTADFITTQVFLSAVTLACLNVYDPCKLEFLVNVTVDEVRDEVRQRALIGVMLVSCRMPSGAFAMDLQEKIEEVCMEDPDLIDEMVSIQKELALTVGSEERSRDFSKDVFDKMSNNLAKMLRERFGDQIGSDSVDTWEDDDYDDEVEDDSIDDYFFEEEVGDDGAADKGGFQSMEVVEPVDLESLSDKGVDVFLPHFKLDVKDDFFFSEVCNWFMPFDVNNPLITQALDKAKGYDLLRFLKLAAQSSPADAYAFAVSFVEAPDDKRSEIVKDFLAVQNTHGEEEDERADSDEATDEEWKENEKREIKHARVGYIRNILRFCKFSIWREDFYDVFEVREKGLSGFAVLNSPLFQSPLFDGARLAVARFATRRRIPEVVKAMLYGHDGSNTLEELYMKGWAASQSDKKEDLLLGIDCFERMLEVQPNLKSACKGLCECYVRFGDIDKYLESFDRLWKLSDGFTEEYKLDLKKEKLKLLFEYGRIDDSIRLAYELEYNHADLEYCSAILNYCLLMRNRAESGDFSKAKERLSTYFADDLKTEDRLKKKEKSGAKDEEMAKDFLLSAMGMFLKFLERDREAEALNFYSMALVYLAEKNIGKAQDSFLRSYIYWRKNGRRKLLDYLKGDSQWLAAHGYDENAVMMLYNGVQLRFLEIGETHKNYANKQQQGK